MDLRMRIDVGVSTGDFELVGDTAVCSVLGCNPKQAAEKSSSATDRWNESQNESRWCCPTQPAAWLVPHPVAASAERRGGVDGHIVATRASVCSSTAQPNLTGNALGNSARSPGWKGPRLEILVCHTTYRRVRSPEKSFSLWYLSSLCSGKSFLFRNTHACGPGTPNLLPRNCGEHQRTKLKLQL